MNSQNDMPLSRVFRAAPFRSFTGSTGPSTGGLKNWSTPAMPPVRFSATWWRVLAIQWTVFAITGSSSMYFTRPALTHLFQQEGSLKEGPTKYRVTYLGIMLPIYASILIVIGTAAGQYDYFRHMVQRMRPFFIASAIITTGVVAHNVYEKQQE